MLYSAMVGFMTYYAVLFVIGVLVNTIAIEGELLTLAVIGFIGAYLVHNYSRFVYRMAMGVGIAASVFLVGIWVLLPIVAGSTTTWLIIFAVFASIAVYVTTRPSIFQYYMTRNTGSPAAPPYGREWCRWLFIVMM